jgi:hypothetical protein
MHDVEHIKHYKANKRFSRQRECAKKEAKFHADEAPVTAAVRSDMITGQLCTIQQR